MTPKSFLKKKRENVLKFFQSAVTFKFTLKYTVNEEREEH